MLIKINFLYIILLTTLTYSQQNKIVQTAAIAAINDVSTVENNDNDSEKSTIYFYRTGMLGAALNLKYYDGEKNIGKSKAGQIIKYKCDPGQHHFGLLINKKLKPEFITVDVKSSEQYYIKTLPKGKNLLKTSILNNKILRKDGLKENKEGIFYIENVTDNLKEISKVSKKIAKKTPLSFTEESLLEDQNKFKDQIAKAYSDHTINKPDIDNSSIVTTPKKKHRIANSYTIANHENEKIGDKKNDYSNISINQLKEKKSKAVLEENYLEAEAIKKEIIKRETKVVKTEQTDAIVESKSNLDNKREIALNEILSKKTKTSKKKLNTVNISSVENSETKSKIHKENKVGDVKYRRSSLYTLMVDDSDREHSNMVKNTFGNFNMPQKFNNHNIGPYLINADKSEKDQAHNITNYLNENSIAKKIVSKWFNRSPQGGFNMDLIAERGIYNATDLDVKIAKNKERAEALLADAGEELIKNTFIIVNDYHFTNKEVVAKKARGFLKVIGSVSNAAGLGNVSTITTLASTGMAVAGKGYVIKTTAYLYRLVWNEEIAATFYNDYWNEDGHIDEAKKESFDNTDLFKLKLIGSQNAFADLQSSIFTKKSNEGLIEIATVKATDKSIAKLERKFEEFRTKSPLLSGDPITAKIGLKEGLEKGDKFEVLEQTINNEGKTTYKRLGIIKVSNNIWDNRYMSEETNNENSDNNYTTFTGAKNKYFAGMLIRQIN